MGPDSNQYRGQPHAPAVATAADPSYVEGQQANQSLDLSGYQRTRGIGAGGNTPITIADGADVTLGALADAAVGDASGSVNAHLRAIASYLTPKNILSATGSVSSNTSIVAAITAKRIKVVFVSLRTAYTAGLILPILTDGNGGTTIFQDPEQALTGSVSGSVNSFSPFGPKTTAGNPLYLNPNGQTVYYTIYYHADDAT